MRILFPNDNSTRIFLKADSLPLFFNLEFDQVMLFHEADHFFKLFNVHT